MRFEASVSGKKGKIGRRTLLISLKRQSISNSTMKFTSVKSLLIVSTLVVTSAFGVNPSPALKKSNTGAIKPAFRKDSTFNSPLVRDPSIVRGGAVPGWAAYNNALDKKPLVTKAMTSLVGWALGDLLAQVRTTTFNLCRVISPLRLSFSRSSSVEDPLT
jgi:hypothetical protein